MPFPQIGVISHFSEQPELYLPLLAPRSQASSPSLMPFPHCNLSCQSGLDEREVSMGKESCRRDSELRTVDEKGVRKGMLTTGVQVQVLEQPEFHLPFSAPRSQVSSPSTLPSPPCNWSVTCKFDTGLVYLQTGTQVQFDEQPEFGAPCRPVSI
jgi:hypothetical protein